MLRTFAASEVDHQTVSACIAPLYTTYGSLPRVHVGLSFSLTTPFNTLFIHWVKRLFCPQGTHTPNL